MKTLFVSDCLLQNIDDIKLAALYFDEIEIVRRVHVKDIAALPDYEQMAITIKADTYPFVSSQLMDHLEVLSREGIVTFSTSTGRNPMFFEETNQPRSLNHEAKRIIGENLNAIFPNAPFKWTSETQASLNVPANYVLVANEEAEAIYGSSELRKFAQFEYESVNKLHYLLDYYTALLEELLHALSTGVSCHTASSTLQSLVASYAHSKTFQDLRLTLEQRVARSPAVALEALRCAVPDLSSASLDDILEFRRAAADELARFRHYMEQLSSKSALASSPLDHVAQAKAILDSQIKPAIEDLSSKIEGLKIGVARSVIRNLRDPKSYAPFLLNMFFDVPAHLLLIAGLGVAGLDMVLEHYKQFKDIRNNGMYYLLKARKAFPPSSRA